MITLVGLGAAAPSHLIAHVAVPERAGGGSHSNPGRSGSFSGGRSSSSSSGGGFRSTGTGYSSGAGGGGSVFGLICLLVVVAIVVVAVMALKKKGLSTTATGAKPSGAPPAPPPPPVGRSPETDAALAAIKARDPGFDEDNFLNGVAISFNLVQKAWVDQTPAESRKVMADGIWVNHRQMIEQMQARNVRNVLEDLHIGRSEIMAAVTDADSESIVVRIHAYSRDYELDQQGQMVSGDRELRLWTEDWSFTRSSSAITKQGSGSRQTCPNCGAPLNLDNAGVCAYCRELVMSGKHDWVLSRIEQVYA